MDHSALEFLAFRLHTQFVLNICDDGDSFPNFNNTVSSALIIVVVYVLVVVVFVVIIVVVVVVVRFHQFSCCRATPTE